MADRFASESSPLMIVSCDCHAGAPAGDYRDYLEPGYRAAYDEVLAVAQAELQRFEDELADSFAGGPYGLDDVELLPTLRNSTSANRKAAPLLALT